MFSEGSCGFSLVDMVSSLTKIHPFCIVFIYFFIFVVLGVLHTQMGGAGGMYLSSECIFKKNECMDILVKIYAQCILCTSTFSPPQKIHPLD